MIVDAGIYELQAAFATRLAEFDPAVLREKSGNEPFLRCWLVPADEAVSGLGSSAPIEAVGFYQVDCNIPIDQGEGLLWKMADAVAKHFKVGSSVSYQDFVAIVTRTTRSGIIAADPGWQRVSVRTYYMAHFRR
ncbi:MAG: hypothetical protein [Caudoviricetes sp.]|nr:MAG: hypothetical protein [Caudoviricetes sp.]